MRWKQFKNKNDHKPFSLTQRRANTKRAQSPSHRVSRVCKQKATENAVILCQGLVYNCKIFPWTEALPVLALFSQVRRYSHLLLCSYSACGTLAVEMHAPHCCSLFSLLHCTMASLLCHPLSFLISKMWLSRLSYTYQILEVEVQIRIGNYKSQVYDTQQHRVITTYTKNNFVKSRDTKTCQSDKCRFFRSAEAAAAPLTFSS